MIVPISINLKMFYVYVLRSIKTRRYYIGSCKNITVRFKQHNMGNVKSTKSYMPWLLVHQESFATLSEDRKREKQIKNWKKRSAIERLLKHF